MDRRVKQICAGFCVASLAALCMACDKPRIIPEDTLQKIIRDELLSQSIVVHSTEPSFRPSDSLDLHTEAMARYGYTLKDFQHTIRELSLRKSNPLEAILQGVSEDIKVESAVAESRYQTKIKIDSVAVAYTADTVFRKDTVLSGSWEGHKFVYTEKGIFHDSVVPQGTYWLETMYSTGSHASSYTKSIRYRRVLNLENQSGSEGTIWVVPAKDTTLFHGEISVGEHVKSLEISFRDTWSASYRNVSNEPDTCYMADIRLIRILPVGEARREFHYRTTGIKPLEDLYYERYLDSMPAFSGPVPPRLGGEAQAE